MIILISGNSMSGKTFMAQRLLETYKIPYLSMDHLKMGIYRSDPNCGFTPLDTKERIGDKLWPIVREMIKTNIENKQHLMIEGCYILPHYLHDFEKSYAEHIVSVCIVFSDRYIREHFESTILQYQHAIEDRGDGVAASDDNMSANIREHRDYRRRCEEAGMPFFEIDRNYELEIAKAYEYIEARREKMMAR